VITVGLSGGPSFDSKVKNKIQKVFSISGNKKTIQIKEDSYFQFHLKATKIGSSKISVKYFIADTKKTLAVLEIPITV